VETDCLPPPVDVEASAVKRDIDERFARMSRYPGVIIFPHGITKVQLDKKGKFQGKEYRSIMKVNLFEFLSFKQTLFLFSFFLPMCSKWLWPSLGIFLMKP